MPPLKRSFVLSDYRKATEGLNIDRTVYMEVDEIKIGETVRISADIYRDGHDILAGRARVLDRFTWRATAEATVAVYRELLAHR